MTHKKGWLICLTLFLALACTFGGGTPAPTPTPTALPSAAPPTATITALPAPTTEPTALPQQIFLDEPAEGTTLTSPVTLRGRTNYVPFEATLLVRIYDGDGQLLAETPIMTAGELGGPGTFAAAVAFGGRPGPGRIEVLDLSAADGGDADVGIIASDSATVFLAGPDGGGYVEIPAPLERVTLPLRILARVGAPGETVHASLTWDDGTQLARDFTTLNGADGHGLLITSLDWITEGAPPPDPGTATALLELRRPDGALLAQQVVIVLSPADPDAVPVTVYWVNGEDLIPVAVRVPSTPRIGAAALEALLWGPTPGNLADFHTMIATPEEIAGWPPRQPAWGERVRLLSLTITDGVATADFSGELAFWQEGGGFAGVSIRARLIREQITQTLLQFSTVQEVHITIEGAPDPLLEP